MKKIKKAKKMVRSLIIVCEILLLALFWFEIVNARLVKMPYEIPNSSIYVEYVNIDYGYTKAELKTKIENLTGQRWYIYREKELEPFTYGQTYIMFRWVEISEDLDLNTYAETLCHELVHLKYNTGDERFTTYQTFVILYESEFRQIALNMLYGQANGQYSYDYDCYAQMVNYLKERTNATY